MKPSPLPSSNFILFTTPNAEVKLEVYLQDETVWLTQKMMAELFDIEISTINYHVGEIYKSAELSEDRTLRKIRIVQSEGRREVSRDLDFYSLDIIIAVGYRVNSVRATQFRIWATMVLREYIVKGFVMNDERLKQGSQAFGKDYFQELLERVRSIRASERRMHLKLTDIFSECSIDYDPRSEATRTFFATIQNIFHFAITGQTAAEIIYSHADSSKNHMGLTTWKNSPDGRILPSDAIVAKNYLQEAEIKKLERTVSGFFDYIENILEQNKSFTMVEFSESVKKFLAFNEYRILDDSGSISAQLAEQKALEEYSKFNKTQKIESDFEKMLKRLTKGSDS